MLKKVGSEAKITQVISGLDHRFGGPPRVALTISELLGNRIDQILVIEPASEILISELRQLGYSVKRFKSATKKSYGIPSVSSLICFIHNLRKSEMILHHGFYLFSLVLCLALSRKNCKIFIMPHGSLDPFQQKKSALKKKVFRNLILRRMQQKSIVVAATEIEKTRVNDVLPTVTVTNLQLGIDVDQEVIQTAQNAEFLFTLSRIASIKRIELCIEALRFLPKSNIGLPLRIYGDGDREYLNFLVSHAIEHGVQEQVEFCGVVPENEKVKLFAEDGGILLLTSDNENFALSVAEAVSHGVPVVVSRGVALSEHVEKYGWGVVCESQQAEAVALAIQKVIKEYSEYSRNCVKSRHALSSSITQENLQRILEVP